MEFALTSEQEELVRQAAVLAGRFSLDYWREHDRTEAYPEEFVAAFRRDG